MKDALGAVQSVLVLGGGSEIGLAMARALAEERARAVVLAARRPGELEQAAADLRAAGAVTVELVPFDADDTASHPALVDQVFSRHGDIDLVLVAFGVLGRQELSERDAAAAVAVVRTNFLGAVSVMTEVANRLREQGHGTIVVLSSVAGERARRSNYVYGSSKSGLDAFSQGLGLALEGSGVSVMVVRPGFVRTKMTADAKAPPFSASPQDVARATVSGLRRGAHTVWVPAAMRLVMAVVRHLPRPLLRRIPI